jgi:Dolichyl-phosphate-mannose-protein mannosyltransferase
MSFFVTTPTLRARSESYSELSPFLTIRLVRGILRLVETHYWIACAVATTACAWGHLGALISRHLDHDELFTSYIAQSPSISQLLTLTRTIDLHPPLSYLLVRLSYAVFGVSSWSCRLPFFLAFLATGAILHFFVCRLVSPIYGLIALLTLWSSYYALLAIEARPYALVLCFTSLLLVSWYHIVTAEERPVTRWRYVALIVAGFALLLSHVLGALAYAAFLGAELIRLWIRRKPDWRLWGALTVPLISTLSYLPLIRIQSGLLFSEYSQASPRRLAICYWEHFRYSITPLALILVLAVTWTLFSQYQKRLRFISSRAAVASLVSLFFFLFLVPLEIYLMFSRTGAPFYERYGVVASIPCALVPALFLAWRTGGNRWAGASVAFVLAALLILNTSGKAWLLENLADIAKPQVATKLLYLVALPPVAPPALKPPPVPPSLEDSANRSPNISLLDSVDPQLPFVAGSGPTFLELDRYEDAAFTRRLYLLTNSVAAATIVHSTLFDHYELLKAVFPIRGQVQNYCMFVRRYPQFIVLGGYNYPDTWLLKKLEMDGARLSIVGRYNDEVIEERDIYKVMITRETCHN